MRTFLLIFALAVSAFGQTLTVGATTGLGSSTVAVPLTLAGGTGAAGLEWTIKYVKTVSILMAATGQGTAAGKLTYCNANGTSVIAQTCVLVALDNANPISDGTVANLYVTLPSNFSGSTALAISGPLGVSPDGDGITLTGTSGKVSSSQSNLRDKEPPLSKLHGAVEIPELVSLTCEAAKVPEGREDERLVHCALDLGTALTRPLRSIVFSNVSTVDLPNEESLLPTGSSGKIFDIPLRNWSKGLSVLLGLKFTDPEDPHDSAILIAKVVEASAEVTDEAHR